MNCSEKQFLIGVAIASFLAGCASVPVQKVVLPAQAIPTLNGSYHRVEVGDTLWGIAHSFGLDVQKLATINRVPDARRLEVGQQLFIPLPKESSHFLWPVRGKHKRSETSEGLKFMVPAGSSVRAARGGRVALAAKRLSGWGKTIIIDHGDGYRTVYSGLEDILVSPGVVVRQGSAIGRVGWGGFHFEIRRGTRARDPLGLLPT